VDVLVDIHSVMEFIAEKKEAYFLVKLYLSLLLI